MGAKEELKSVALPSGQVLPSLFPGQWERGLKYVIEMSLGPVKNPAIQCTSSLSYFPYHSHGG